MGTSIERVTAAAAARGLDIEVRRFPEGTRTAADAAAAIGCPVAAIVKSIVLQSDDGPLVVLASGANRIDIAKVAAATGRSGVRRADPTVVRAATGYAIGGTPPFGHATELDVLVDTDLMELEEVWAAAGAPDAVFCITPAQLVTAADATGVDIAERS